MTESLYRANRIEEARRLLDIAINFREGGWGVKAKRFASRALAIFEREYGAYHPDVVPVLLCLAGAREDLADYARAGADYRRANDILDLSDDPQSLEVQRRRIQTLRGLANVTRALGQSRQAETILKEAVAIAERAFGRSDGDVADTDPMLRAKHGDVASALNDLAVHYRHSGAYETASNLHHRVLAIAEQALGPDHAQTATILHQLGVLEQARGQFASGEQFARRSAEIQQKTFGPDHPQLAAELTMVASLLDAQGKHEEAKPIQRRAATITERWFGPDHRDVATTPDVEELETLRIA